MVYLLVLAATGTGVADLAAQSPRKYALLVGVQNYPRGVLGNLKHMENDVDELADWLKTEGGYDVVSVMTQTRAAKQAELFPSSDNITSNLKELLKLVRRGDHVLIAFSGHGVQLRIKRGDKEEVKPFFCPADVKLDDDKRFRNLVGLKEVYDALEESNASVKLLVVDACREHKGDRGNGEEFAPLDPPKGIAAFFSCGSNEKSFEFEDDAQPKHGIFFHHLLAGLSGKAANAKGEVTLEQLAEYVKREVSIDVKRTISVRARQNPNVKADFTGTPLVLALASANRDPRPGPPVGAMTSGKELTPGEVRGFEIASGAKMKFCWIPPGEAQLGSPKVEQEYVTKRYFDGKRPKWMDDENESKRGKYVSKGFWLGKYPVTQVEWQAAMGSNPSYCSKDGGGKDMVAGMDTSRFPVEMVSWEDCGKFFEKLNDSSGKKAFGKGGKFVLPHEDEWEYACRGGLGNKRAFYFGNALNDSQANCNGNYPYGTDTKGPYKRRTTEVGAYESESPHPWGWCDMHGNVWQWCENWSDSEKRFRMRCGGCWIDRPSLLRAASRTGHACRGLAFSF